MVCFLVATALGWEGALGWGGTLHPGGRKATQMKAQVIKDDVTWYHVAHGLQWDVYCISLE